jgi:hypothetical protein
MRGAEMKALQMASQVLTNSNKMATKSKVQCPRVATASFVLLCWSDPLVTCAYLLQVFAYCLLLEHTNRPIDVLQPRNGQFETPTTNSA